MKTSFQQQCFSGLRRLAKSSQWVTSRGWIVRVLVLVVATLGPVSDPAFGQASQWNYEESVDRVFPPHLSVLEGKIGLITVTIFRPSKTDIRLSIAFERDQTASVSVWNMAECLSCQLNRTSDLTPVRREELVAGAAKLATVRRTVMPQQYFLSWLDTVLRVEAKSAASLKGEALRFSKQGEISLVLDGTVYLVDTSVGQWRRTMALNGPDVDGAGGGPVAPLMGAIRKALRETDSKLPQVPAMIR